MNPKHAKEVIFNEEPHNIYYIDLENTGSRGLNGLLKLPEEDKVIIAYTNKSCKLSMDRVQDIIEAKADVTAMKMQCGMKDALDFQLSTLAVVNAERSDDNVSHVIISSDHGYDIVCKQANKLGINNISRRCNLLPQEDPDDILTDSDYEKGRFHCITVLGVSQKNRRIVAEYVNISKSRIEFYNKLKIDQRVSNNDFDKIKSSVDKYLDKLLELQEP